MTNDQLQRWGQRYNLTLIQVKTLQRLADRHYIQSVKWANGDPHPSVLNHNKTACVRAWEKELDKTQEEFTRLAISLGFDKVEYSLTPTLEKDGDTSIEVPDSEEK